MTESTLAILPGSAIRITHVDGTAIRHPNLLNDAQWGDAFSWERPDDLAFTFPDQTTAIAFADADRQLTRDPISGSTVTDQQLTQPVTVNGRSFVPSSHTTLWETPPPVFLENVYEVTLVDSFGTEYRMAGIGITEGYHTTVVGVVFDGPAPPAGTTLFYHQGNTSFVDRGHSLPITDSVACFVAGTLIDTPDGPRAIEDLRIGHLVRTLDHGPRPIRWIGRSRVGGRGVLAPIRLAAEALGNVRDLRVSPNHRVLLRSASADLQFGSNDVLVAAKFLVDGRSIVREPTAMADYLHLMLDGHEILFSEGIATESMLAGQMARRGLHAAAGAELRALFPDLDSQAITPCRPCLGRREARLLLSRGTPTGVGASVSRLPLHPGLCVRETGTALATLALR